MSRVGGYALCVALAAAVTAVASGAALAQQATGQPLPQVLLPGQDVTGQDVPLQSETDQDGTGRDVTGQGVTGQDVPIQSVTDQAATGQEGTGQDGTGQDGTVPQARFDTPQQDQDAAAPQPRFVRVPGAGGIEVTPLAPPAQPDAGQPGTGDVARPGDTGATGALTQPQPDVLAPRGPGDTAITDDTRSRAAARASRFKFPPKEISPLTRPTGPAIPIDAPPTDLREGVRLRELDKMTGQTETFELAVGETRQVDRLKIELEACRSPQGNDTHGTMAFLKVWDIRDPDTEQFSGWMFAESPSLSALDHPRYDLWVISCTTSSVASTAPSQ